MGTRIGIEIKVARKKAGKTQQEVADSLGVSVQAISQWENGHTDPSAQNLMKLKNTIGLNLDTNFTLKDVMRTESVFSRDPQLRAPVVPWDAPDKWHRYNRDLNENWGDWDDEPEVFFEVKWTPIGDVYALEVSRRYEYNPQFRTGDVIILDTGRAPERGDYVIARLPERRLFNRAFVAQYWPLGVDEHRAPIFELDIGGTERLKVDASNPGEVIGTVREHRRYYRSS